MIILRESAGDKTLYKFWIYKIPKLENIADNNWNDTLQGYLFYNSYFYNIYNRESNAKEVTHDIIEQSIPAEIRTRLNKDNYMAYGGTDCYLAYHGQQNPIRLWTVDNNSILTKADKEYLKRLFHADYYR